MCDFVNRVYKKFLYDSLSPFERALKMELYYVERVYECDDIVLIDLISLYDGHHEEVGLKYFTGLVSAEDGYDDFIGIHRFQEYHDIDESYNE